MREFLASFRNWFFAQKYRFDLGLGFLVFLNFALLVIAASEKLKTIFGLEHISELLLLLIPVAFVGVWLFGYFLDSVAHAQSATEGEAGKRSVLWRKNFEKLDKLDADVAEIKKKISRR